MFCVAFYLLGDMDVVKSRTCVTFLWFCFCELAFSSVSMLCCFILVTIIMHFNVFQLCLGQAAIEKLDDTELNGRRIKLVPEKG